MLKDRKAYEARLDEQLASWEAEIERFKVKAKGVGVDGMMKFDQAIELMQRKNGEARVHLDNLKTTGDDTWEQVKSATEKAWAEFKAIFKSSPS
jgi:hypothetical protein